MTIDLPKLERLVFKEAGNKTVIKQLIAPATSQYATVLEEGKDFVKLSINNLTYYLSNSKQNVPEEVDYALQTTGIPTAEGLIDSQIRLKKWLKHPEENGSSVNEVLDSWSNNFSFKEENLEKGIKGLRQPQIGALYMIMGHLTLPSDTGTVVLPTGTGKTETMLSALIANKCSCLLVTVPSDSLRDQIANKFTSLGLLKEFGIVGQDAQFPVLGVIKQGFDNVISLSSFVKECNVVVTTMSILTGCSEDQQEFLSDFCSNIFIDEAHHVKAKTWDLFKNKFSPAKVLQFTATPFRNDGKRLDGKIIFNFPLKLAQEQGYFKQIDFIPVREYDPEKADKLIAEVAVARLREDIARGFNHILMARCYPKERARQIFKLYEEHTDLNPVLIYSGVPNFKQTYESIISKQSKIIVCVDMLGEGFDLPELKIAAFHNIRKSLPITLQFAGRFTRTKHDEELGNASFVANIADTEVRNELEDLYAHDADWNAILSDSSFYRIKNEVEYKNLISGFSNLGASNIPFQYIKPKLSTVVYRNLTTEWFPKNYSKGIPGFDNLEYVFYDINSEEKILVIITARREENDWLKHDDIYSIKWDVIVVYWETRNNLLFINSSDNSSLYAELAHAIIGDNARLICGVDVFKTFYNIKRTKLQNVGLRYFLGKNERFRMSVGFDVAEALSIAEKQKGEKAFVMGVGFENGQPMNLGASYKGRIWTKQVGDLMAFKNWCINVGNKLTDTKIDPNQILRETLIPEAITSFPDIRPFWIDWDVDLLLSSETRVNFIIGGIISDLSNTEINLIDPKEGEPVLFSISTELNLATFELQIFSNDSDPDNTFPDYRIISKDTPEITVEIGKRRLRGSEFLEEYLPTIWFVDGSALTGNEYVQLKQTIKSYPKEDLIAWNWTGVNLSKEAQGVDPKAIDSIQYKVIKELKKGDYDIIYDDDYSGEIADVVTLKLRSDKLEVKFYHLKFAIDGLVSRQVKNLYEVCGQAQKSIHWKHKEGSKFINHLLRRETKVKKGKSCSRLERGARTDLEKFLTIAKREIPMEFEIYIVQPGISKATATTEILTLLGVTENYIKEMADINLRVIVSE